MPRCARHAPAYLFELSKLGELRPGPIAPDDPLITGYGQDAPIHPSAQLSVKAAQRKYKQSQWRRKCLKVRPFVCIAAGLGGCEGRLECDHVWPKSQGGPYVVENGVFVCAKHHKMKTDSELKYRRIWLAPDQVAWLAEMDWVRWLPNGDVAGRGWRHFEPVEVESWRRS